MYITLQNDNEGIRLPWSLIGGLGRETLVSSCGTPVQLLSKASSNIEPRIFHLGSVRHYLLIMVGEPRLSLVGIGAVKKENETEILLKESNTKTFFQRNKGSWELDWTVRKKIFGPREKRRTESLCCVKLR